MLSMPRLGPSSDGCTGEARCGRCAGPHSTANHTCTHDHPCPTGQRCHVDKPKCTNCQGEHSSWTQACPAAKAVLKSQEQKVEYATGKYESYPPFTFADADYTPGKPHESRPQIPTPPPSHLQINYIPAT